jgi:hypothetical protein
MKTTTLLTFILVASACGQSPKLLMAAEAQSLAGPTWTVVDVRPAYAGFGAEGEAIVIISGSNTRSFVASTGHPYRVGRRFQVEKVADIYMARNVGEVIIPKFQEER